MAHPKPSAVLEPLKPITWFPPMWAFACGVVCRVCRRASGGCSSPPASRLAGPMVCATSQAVNDWFDRHVDAINEPQRPIPSGRIPGRWGLWIACTRLDRAFRAARLPARSRLPCRGDRRADPGMGQLPPARRLKAERLVGHLAVGACYEGLPWFTGAADYRAAAPDYASSSSPRSTASAPHGIMTLNDFKVRSTATREWACARSRCSSGRKRAARLACVFMTIPNSPSSACCFCGTGCCTNAIAVGGLTSPRRSC